MLNWLDQDGNASTSLRLLVKRGWRDLKLLKLFNSYDANECVACLHFSVVWFCIFTSVLLNERFIVIKSNCFAEYNIRATQIHWSNRIKWLRSCHPFCSHESKHQSQYNLRYIALPLLSKFIKNSVFMCVSVKIHRNPPRGESSPRDHLKLGTLCHYINYVFPLPHIDFY